MTPKDPGDGPLIDRCLGGDLEAYGEIVDRYSGRLINVALMMVGDRHDAEDLAQEAFIRAYRGLGNFRGRARFSSWLYQITLNLCRDHLKARSRRGRRMEEEALESVADGGDAVPATRALLEAELSETMRREINTLPYVYREAFVLRHLQGLEYEEVAGITGVPADTVRVRAYRAREMLREKLAPAVDTYWREKAAKERVR